MTHTPAPWKWFNYPDGRKLLSGPNQAVIHCPDAPMTCDEGDANLIAAAPEMLAALRMIESVYRLNCVHEGEPSSVLDALQAAIAKAEGRA
jgi:hypothetical protein